MLLQQRTYLFPLMLCSAHISRAMRRIPLVLFMTAVICHHCCHTADYASTNVVPVTVSTLSRSTSGVSDLTFDGNGNLLFVSSSLQSVYRLTANGTVLLLSGSGNGTSGDANGVPSVALFNNPLGISCDVTKNIVYISDSNNYRIRSQVLATNNVTTLAGASFGHRDGNGTAAWFHYTLGIVFHSSGVLYVTDNYHDPDSGVDYCYIRKIVVASAKVTTITTVDGFYIASYLCINTPGTVLYFTTAYVVFQMNLSTTVMVALAGTVDTPGTTNGVGTVVRFNSPRGIALNTDETALIIADQNNLLIRLLVIASKTVTTVAGSTTAGSNDGPGLAATFQSPFGAKWHCNVSSALCGILVADTNNNAVRFVSVERMPTATNALSAEVTSTLSISPTESSSSTTTASRSQSESFPVVSTSHYLTFSVSSTGGSRTKICSLSIPSTPTISRSLSVIRTYSPSPSATNATSLTRSVSASRSRSYEQSKSHSTSATSSNGTVALTASPSRTKSDNKSASVTRRTASPTVTTFCALVPADGETAIGTLQIFNASITVRKNVVPLSPQPTVPGMSSPEAATVSRAVLLRNPPLGANLSISLGGTIRGGALDGWELLAVKLNVLPVNSLFPLMTADVPFVLESSGVVGRTQSLVVFFEPPNATTPPRWLPTSLSTFRDVTLVLQLSLRCPADAAITVIVTIEVPCRGEVQPLASEVKTTGSVAQYSTSFAGPATGGAVGRLASVRSLVLCSGDAVVEGLLPLEVDSCGDDGDSVASGARGGILGNLVLWAAVCALMAVAVATYAHVGRTTLRVSAEALGVPSPLLPLVVVTVPSTVSSTFYLLHTSRCASDDVIGVLGIVMVVAPIVALCLVAYGVSRRLTRVRPQHTKTPKSDGAFRLNLRFSPLFVRRTKWSAVHVDSFESAGGTKAIPDVRHTWLRVTAVLLLEYASVWYACADVVLLTASCVLGALGMLESASACRGGAIAVLVLYIAQLILCAVVRPFTALFSHGYGLYSLALSVVAVACQVWYLFGSTADNVDLDVLTRLLTASAVCDLLVSGVSMLKMLLDIVDAVKACRRHASVLCPSSNGRRLSSTGALRVSGADELRVVEDAVLLTSLELPPNRDDDSDIVSTVAEIEGLFGEDSVGIFTASEKMRARKDNDLTRCLERVQEEANIFDD